MVVYKLTRFAFFSYLAVNTVLCASWEDNLKELVRNGNIPKWMKEQIKADFASCNPASFLERIGIYLRKNIGRRKNSIFGLFIQRYIQEASICSNWCSWRSRSFFVSRAIERLSSILPLPDVEFAISLAMASVIMCLFQFRFLFFLNVEGFMI